eukprot:3329298-Prymnesium_polylepis.1
MRAAVAARGGVAWRSEAPSRRGRCTRGAAGPSVGAPSPTAAGAPPPRTRRRGTPGAVRACWLVSVRRAAARTRLRALQARHAPPTDRAAMRPAHRHSGRRTTAPRAPPPRWCAAAAPRFPTRQTPPAARRAPSAAGQPPPSARPWPLWISSCCPCCSATAGQNTP